MTKASPQDYLKLHLIVVILGFTAILGRLTDVSALGVVFYRTLLASLGMLVVAKIQKRNILKPVVIIYHFRGVRFIRIEIKKSG